MLEFSYKVYCIMLCVSYLKLIYLVQLLLVGHSISGLPWSTDCKFNLHLVRLVLCVFIGENFVYYFQVWSNPGIVLPPQNFGNSEDKWLQYAAKLVHAAMDYKSRLDVGTIGVEMSGKAPMDMQQYYKLFGASRISGSPKDIQQFKPKSTYAVVIHNGNVSIKRKIF